MPKTILTSTLALAATLSLGLAAPAFAAPVDLDTSVGQIIQVYGGCGVFGHRGPYGGCRTGGQFGGYVRGRSCPAGFHMGPLGVRCRANVF